MTTVGKADDLVFNRRAITWSGRIDLAAVHRRAVQLARIRSCTGRLVCVIQQGSCSTSSGSDRNEKKLGCCIARLFFGLAVVDGATIEPSGRAGFEAFDLESQSLQAPG